MSLTIGEFARIGGVSTRMLRHYDGLGLLTPDRVDDASGYRYYGAAQLTRLNHLVALKDLGFSLDEVGALLDAPPELTAERLASRRAELAASIAADQHRLATVDARLALVNAVPSDLAFVAKPLPALRLMQLSAQVEDASELDQYVGPLFGQLMGKLTHRGVRVPQPAYAWYEARGDVMAFGVGFSATTDQPGRGVELAELPAHPLGLTVIHHGEMARINATWQALAREAEARGLTISGPGREIYHDTPEHQRDWVTEVQLPVVHHAP